VAPQCVTWVSSLGWKRMWGVCFQSSNPPILQSSKRQLELGMLTGLTPGRWASRTNLGATSTVDKGIKSLSHALNTLIPSLTQLGVQSTVGRQVGRYLCRANQLGSASSPPDHQALKHFGSTFNASRKQNHSTPSLTAILRVQRSNQHRMNTHLFPPNFPTSATFTITQLGFGPRLQGQHANSQTAQLVITAQLCIS